MERLKDRFRLSNRCGAHFVATLCEKFFATRSERRRDARAARGESRSDRAEILRAARRPRAGRSARGAAGRRPSSAPTSAPAGPSSDSERFRDLGPGSVEQDAVEPLARRARQGRRPISRRDLARLDDLEMLGRALRQRVEALDRDHLRAEPRQERRHVAAAGADFEHPLARSERRAPAAWRRRCAAPSWSGRRAAAGRRRCAARSVKRRGREDLARHELHGAQQRRCRGCRARAATG